MARITAFVMALLVLAAAQGPGEASPRVVTLGLQAPFSGPLSKQGRDLEAAVRMAIDEANAETRPGTPIFVLRRGDDKGDPREGLLAARHLLASGVAGVVGPWNSGVTLPVVSEVYGPAGLPVLTMSTHPKITERGWSNVFRVIGRDDRQGRIAASEALKLGLRTAVVLDNRGAYGKGLADRFAEAFEAGGGRVLSRESFATGEADRGPLLARARALGPRLLYLACEYQDAGPLVRQWRRLGTASTRVLAGDAVCDPLFVRLAGTKAAEGTMLTFPEPADARFEARLRNRGVTPGAFSGHAYDAARLLIEAIRSAGPGAGRKAVVARLAAVRDHRGATGLISFDAKGDLRRAGFALWQVRDGRFQVLR